MLLLRVLYSVHVSSLYYYLYLACWMATLSAMPSVSFLQAFLALCNCPQIGTLWPPVRLTANVTHSLWFCCITQLFLNVLSVLLGHWLTENLSNPDDASLRFANLRFFGLWSKYSRWRKTVFKYLPAPLTNTLFHSWFMDISFKDDIIVLVRLAFSDC